MLKRKKWIPIASAVFAITVLAVAVFFISLLKVDVLIGEILLIIAAVMALLLFVAGLLLFKGLHRKRSAMRRIRRIIGLVLCLVVVFCSVFGTILMHNVEKTKTQISNAKSDEQPRSIVGVYVTDGDGAQKLSDMGAYTFAVLGELGAEKLNSNYAIGAINNAIGAEVKTVSYPGITDAASALRNGDVQAMVVSKTFILLLEDAENFAEFAETLRLVDEIPVPYNATLENTPIVIASIAAAPEDPDTTPAPTPVPTPSPTPAPLFGEDQTLVVYLSGLDKWEAGASNIHSDVNILMFINSKTRQVMLINTPRDFYMVNPALGGYDKLTHCGIQGVYNSIEALERFYNLDIDNFARVNFTGFEQFVDSIGGITLDNPVEFTGDAPGYRPVRFPVGELHLNGEEALVYSREREPFGDGDLGRGRNQLRVLTAILDNIKKNGASVLMNHAQILEAMGNCVDTDFTSDQISDLAKLATRYLNEWDIKSYGVIGDTGMAVTASGGTEPLYIIWPRQNSVDFAVRLMNMIQNDEIITDEVLAEAPLPY